MTISLEEHVRAAIREEIVRQYRDDERGKCQAGAAYYEEHIGPEYIARAAIAAVRGREGAEKNEPWCAHVSSTPESHTLDGVPIPHPAEAMRAKCFDALAALIPQRQPPEAP